MRNLTSLFLACALLLCGTFVQAQTTKGVSLHVYSGSYMENGEEKTFDVNDVYNVSIADKFLVHNVFDADGVITDSQFYKISNVSVEDVEGIISYKFDATSGVSGNVYKYDAVIMSGIVALTRTQPNGSMDTFIGISVTLKTYQQ